MNQSTLYEKITNGLKTLKDNDKKFIRVVLKKSKTYIYLVDNGKGIIVANKGTDNLKEIDYLCNLLLRKFDGKNIATIDQVSYYDVPFKKNFHYKLIELK